ncbi:uncharacterized protein TRIADDRAFT_52347 [Trichoplax adhaerens]|uniref:LysM domain-containing protein n=1 Tax=Trichoplax adhaerens TaxID=10228 RepID=B3RI16_TRIAD|nr:hypothetical protein TRIADDRAFT_52347 [Trichoplax adhaerens]EDV29687.1 hypothetical protein TRIADDRAFT_52347 [Trichoplax adhaerens]|eukprot:XP_002108889.1 hypothetical protein TRIADDRAFT_52347 [Trichoplax adhaerens]
MDGLTTSQISASEQTSLALANGSRRTCYGSTSSQESNQSTVIVQHTISKYDTLQGIALRYGATIENLRRHNKIWAQDRLVIGAVLRVPINKANYDYKNPNEAIINKTSSQKEECNKHHEKSVDSKKYGYSDSQSDGITDLLSKVDQQLEACKEFNVKMEKNLSDPVRRYQENSSKDELPWKPIKKDHSIIQTQEVDNCIESDSDEMQEPLV